MLRIHHEILIASAFVAGCGSAPAHPAPSPERPAIDVLFADRIDDRDFVILRYAGSREQVVSEETDWSEYLEVAPIGERAPEHVTLFGPDGRCIAPVTAAVRIERMLMPMYPEEDSERLVAEFEAFEVFEVDAPCEGWLAVLGDGEDVEFSPAVYEREYEHGGENAFGHFDERWRFLEHRGPPLDEICPDFPVFEVLEGDRSAARVGSRGYVELRGMISRAGVRALVLDDVFHRMLVGFDGDTIQRATLPSQVTNDEGASPCL